MGMGSIPLHAWTISHQQLQILIPSAWAELQLQLDTHGIQLNHLTRARDEEEAVSESDQTCQGIDAALQRLCDAFREATRVGDICLELELIHYSAECGSRYDELDPGANWLVAGVQQLTPAGEKFRDAIEWKSWTVFG